MAPGSLMMNLRRHSSRRSMKSALKSFGEYVERMFSRATRTNCRKVMRPFGRGGAATPWIGEPCAGEPLLFEVTHNDCWCVMVSEFRWLAQVAVVKASAIPLLCEHLIGAASQPNAQLMSEKGIMEGGAGDASSQPWMHCGLRHNRSRF